MKIAIIVRILWPGGVQRTAFAEAEGLTRLGNDVDLIFIRKTNRYTYNSKILYKVIYDDKVNSRFLAKLLRKITTHYNPQRGSDATVDLDLIRKFEHSIKKQDIPSLTPVSTTISGFKRSTKTYTEIASSSDNMLKLLSFP